MALTSRVAAAYTATGAAWERGPARVYDRLADVLVRRSPSSLTGCRAVDVGTGTGAAARALVAAGAASVVALDAAFGMVAVDARHRPPAVVGDATRLPFPSVAFDVAVAAFSLNHLVDPAAGLRELARVVRRGGVVLASAYAEDDTHPVKEAVEAVLTARGWTVEPWYAQLRSEVTPLLATVEGFSSVADAAGVPAEVDHVRVPFPQLGPRDLVEWRLGMAQHAPFLARLPAHEREQIVADAMERLGRDAPPLVRSVIVLHAVRS